MFCVRCFLRKNNVRWVSTKRKIVAEFDTDIHMGIKNESIKFKKHPGVLKITPPEIPEKLLNAIRFITRDKPIKAFLKDGEAFSRYLAGRQPPLEEDTAKERGDMFVEQLKKRYNINEDAPTPKQEKLVAKKLHQLMGKYTYNWKQLNYDSYLSCVYLICRTAPEYATLCRVFNEIFSRDKTFKPQSLFDFGSGVGTVSWAAKRYWNDSLKEFYCVDTSSHMNDIAQGLLQDGQIKSDPLKGVSFRQFLPSQHTPYDIVVTAFSLFELPSRQARLDTLINLWNKTRKYLVIVEQGTYSGFKLINEARDFILLSNPVKNSKRPTSVVSVFAPCPHDMSCPRLSEDNTPCNFEVNYNVLPLDNKERVGKQRFSYVILARGNEMHEDKHWPRLVRPVLRRSGHAVCRFCTAEGKLQEIVFSAAKNGKIPFLCARSSKWGDILPVKLSEKEIVIDEEKVLSNHREYTEDDCDDDNNNNEDGISCSSEKHIEEENSTKKH